MSWNIWEGYGTEDEELEMMAIEIAKNGQEGNGKSISLPIKLLTFFFFSDFISKEYVV